ncbi:P-type conjugative transfer protein TrbL [Commensalibacter nepenthis]|uniref:P-type conjugative transfer protein TrbL n=1 Tax=Commensalibacter nepenthis TaxID=3043872 RepID=A0ABT6QAV6_9PROT|nr:P-type conjugative transfer protein TrbL [Commensalibacter sp. TBRC 10068]MDI2113887.1 P-type conjugative transfer protein TrbL [Commensalibacter sp. TBRC 10068]
MLNKKYLICILLLSLFFLSYPAHAADDFLGAIVSPYEQASRTTATSVLVYAKNLFWILAGIQFVGSSIKLGLQGADIQEWAAHIVRQILFIGIYAWLMENSYTFSLDIIQSFRNAASSTELHPNNIFAVGFNIANAITKNSSIFHPFDSVLYAIACLILIISFAWISALVVVALCEMYILIGAGVLLMGFGGSEWTRDFANKVLILVVGIGAKLFIMQILINTGINIIDGWASWNYSGNYTAVWKAIAGSVVFVLLTMQLPNMAQQFISGAATGSTAAQGIKAVTQAAATATMAATGAGMAVQAASKAGQAASGAGIGGSSGGLNPFSGSAGQKSNMVSSSKMGGQAGNNSSKIGLQQIGKSENGQVKNASNIASQANKSTGSSSGASNVAGGSADTGSVAGGSADTGNVAGGSADTGNVAGGSADTGSVAGGSANTGSVSQGTPAAKAGTAVNAMGKALWGGIKQEAYARMTGTGTRLGTTGGRIAQYIKDNQLQESYDQSSEQQTNNVQNSLKSSSDEQNTIS